MQIKIKGEQLIMAAKKTVAKKTVKKVAAKKGPKAKVAEKNLVTRVEFATKLAAETGMSVAAATAAYVATFDLVRGYVKQGRKVAIRHFGSFSLRARAARPGYNPIALKKITVKACKVIKFKSSNEFKKMVNGKK